LNLTTGGDGLWRCANGIARTNWTDASLCSGSVCPRTNKAVGWQNENYTYHRKQKVPSAACNATTEELCGGVRSNFEACTHCIYNHSATLKSLGGGCVNSVGLSFCAAPPKPDASCAARAEKLCGWSKTSSGVHDCRLCLSKNRTALSMNETACSADMIAYLRRAGNFCPIPPNSWFGPKNQTWIDGGWKPNHAAIVNTLVRKPPTPDKTISWHTPR
jgi:hypothetical protein